jgi:hypothetical protein
MDKVSNNDLFMAAGALNAATGACMLLKPKRTMVSESN